MTPGTELVVAVSAATKRFGDVLALDAVDLEVHAGESVGLLGPNGAGKTTLISLLCGLRRPDSGVVRIFGGDPRDPAQRRRLGVTPQATGVPETLRVGEVLDLVQSHFAAPVPTEELLARFDLEDLRDRQCGSLSGGQQRRLLVAVSVAGNPRLLILDEPTTGLDVPARDALWVTLRRYAEDGGTLLLTSHYLAEIEALAKRVVVVDHGQVIADGTVEAIRGQVQLRRVSFATQVPDAELAALAGAEQVERQDDRTTILTRDADAAVRALVRADVDFRDLEVHSASLEEAFVAMTGPTGTEPVTSGRAR